MVTEEAIADGLTRLGLDRSCPVIAHASLRSFGWVDGGAGAVCRALTRTCGTVLMVAGTSDLTGLPAPPGLVRPDNAFMNAGSWQEFDDTLDRAVPFAPDLPVDRELGAIAETLRLAPGAERGDHPLFSFVAVGTQARRLVGAQRLDWPLGPIEALAGLGGDVLLIGVTHTANTAIHLAEQRLGRGRFYRYAKAAPDAWLELPNLPGDSHRFDGIAPVLAPATQQVWVGDCRIRRLPVAEVLGHTERLIAEDPATLLCDDRDCRCHAALRQRLAAAGG